MHRSDPLTDPGPLVRRVYSYVAYRLGDGPAAEDLTSDVFERALRYREAYDPEKGEPLAWLIGIARYRIAELGAANGVPVSESDPAESPDAVSLEDEAVRRLTLAQAVRSLDERDRELIALRYGADLTARQIADLVGMRTNAAEVALSRALARLRTALATDTPGVRGANGREDGA